MKKFIILFLSFFYISCTDDRLIGTINIDNNYIERCFSSDYHTLRSSFKVNNKRYQKEIQDIKILYDVRNKLPYNKCDYHSWHLNNFAGIDIPEQYLGREVYGFYDYLNGVQCLFKNKKGKPFAIIITTDNEFFSYKMCEPQTKEFRINNSYFTSTIYSTKEICQEIHAPFCKRIYLFAEQCDSLKEEELNEIKKVTTLVSDFNFSERNNCLVQVTFVNWDNFK